MQLLPLPAFRYAVDANNAVLCSYCHCQHLSTAKTDGDANNAATATASIPVCSCLIAKAILVAYDKAFSAFLHSWLKIILLLAAPAGLWLP